MIYGDLPELNMVIFHTVNNQKVNTCFMAQADQRGRAGSTFAKLSRVAPDQHGQSKRDDAWMFDQICSLSLLGQ